MRTPPNRPKITSPTLSRETGPAALSTAMRGRRSNASYSAVGGIADMAGLVLDRPSPRMTQARHRWCAAAAESFLRFSQRQPGDPPSSPGFGAEGARGSSIQHNLDAAVLFLALYPEADGDASNACSPEMAALELPAMRGPLTLVGAFDSPTQGRCRPQHRLPAAHRAQLRARANEELVRSSRRFEKAGTSYGSTVARSSR